jgi:hypothetical protein
VWPYDSFDNSTIAPEYGASGNAILLTSFNNHARSSGLHQLAWCWSCNAWVETVRKTRMDILLAYARREGVQFRFHEKIIDAPLDSDRRAAALASAIDMKRENRLAGSGILTLRPRQRKARSA